MSEAVESALLKAWIYLACAAGAITGAFLKPGLTPWGRAFALFTGMSASVFMGPLIVARVMPNASGDSREAAFLYYLLACSANLALPELIRHVSQWLGDPLSFLKPKGGAE